MRSFVRPSGIPLFCNTRAVRDMYLRLFIYLSARYRENFFPLLFFWPIMKLFPFKFSPFIYLFL